MRTHNICLYKKVNKKYTGCNKTTEFHECALIGVCAVIRSNTVVAFTLMKIFDYMTNYEKKRYEYMKIILRACTISCTAISKC